MKNMICLLSIYLVTIVLLPFFYKEPEEDTVQVAEEVHVDQALFF